MRKHVALLGVTLVFVSIGISVYINNLTHKTYPTNEPSLNQQQSVPKQDTQFKEEALAGYYAKPIRQVVMAYLNGRWQNIDISTTALFPVKSLVHINGKRYFRISTSLGDMVIQAVDVDLMNSKDAQRLNSTPQEKQQSDPGHLPPKNIAPPLQKPQQRPQSRPNLQFPSPEDNPTNHFGSYVFQNRGLQNRNLSVLRKTRGIACLLELGFINNPDEAAQLINPEYQIKAAYGIAAGIINYSNNSGRQKIAIFPGHGAGDPGATFTFNGTLIKESDIAAAVATRVTAILRDKGYEVLQITPKKEKFRSKRVKDANDFGAEIVVSIHCNSSPNPSAKPRGTECLYYTDQGAVLAESVLDYYLKSVNTGSTTFLGSL